MIVLIRKEPKDHGSMRIAEIDFSDWDKPRDLILVDDVLTTGSSVREMQKVIETYAIPFRIKCVVCIVNRNSPTLQYVPDTDIPLYSLLNLKDLFPAKSVGLQERINWTQNATTKKMMTLMLTKQTNVCLAADIDDIDRLIRIIDDIGPYIFMVKLHLDTFAFDKRVIDVTQKQNVLMMADYKFSDIESTMDKKLKMLQLKDNSGISLCTVHAIGF